MNFNPLNYPPYNHFQLSSDNKCDAEACLSFARVSAVVPLCKLYGDNTDYNPEYLAETSHTTPQGNTEFNIDVAYYQDGLVSTDVLPCLTEFTWAQLYNRDLTKIIPIGQRFWDRYDPAKSTVTQIDPKTAVAVSQQATFQNPYTVQIIVDLNNGLGSPLYHSQALLSAKIWDSYPTNPKILNHPITWAYKITLTPTNMSASLLVNNKGTWGLFQQAGAKTPELGEATLINMCNNAGYALPTLNNGSAVDWANVKPDITIS